MKILIIQKKEKNKNDKYKKNSHNIKERVINKSDKNQNFDSVQMLMQRTQNKEPPKTKSPKKKKKN